MRNDQGRVCHDYVRLETLEEHLSCDGGTNYALAREFIWGDRFPQPVALITHGGVSGGFGGSAVPPGESIYHYLHDVLGSVVALTNAAGQVVERYTYDPYGKTVIEATDPATGRPLRDPQTGAPLGRLPASAFGNPFAWTGQRYDAGVRLYHFLYRSYSPQLGRWLQRDPLGYVDSANLYEYVRSAPLFFVDIFGLDTVAIYDCGDKGGEPGDARADLKPKCKKKRGRIADRRHFERAADDYDHAICARSLEEARDRLRELKKKGVKIDEVHIFDHGAEGYQEIGDDYIDPRSPDDKKTLGEIGELMEPDGIISLEGCSVAGPSPGFNNSPDYIQDVADAAGRAVQGYTGPTKIYGAPIPFVKDHRNTGDRVIKQPQALPGRAP